MGDEKLFGSINMVSNISQIIAMFMVAPFIKKFGKRNVLIVGSIILISSNVMFIIVGQDYIGVIFSSAIKGIGSVE